MSLGKSLGIALWSNVEFRDGQELLKFQYRFTCAILAFSFLVTLLFLITTWAGLSSYHQTYLTGGKLFMIDSIISWLLVRGRPNRLMPIAGQFALAALALYAVTFLYNGADELRVIWMVLNLPGVYLVLGRRWGIGVTLSTMIYVVVANPYLDHPYSINALVTMVMSLGYASAFFHAFSARSISFHHAMVEANQRLADLAAKDPLTGLFNARAYYAQCERALEQSRRGDGPLAMLFVDLDHFKSINDRFGHEAGDLVLKSVANCLMSGVRQSDLVGRIGGEEFSVLLPDTGLDGAMQLAEKLRSDIEGLMPDIGSQRLTVTANIGVARRRPGTETIPEIQRHADEAMYEAKRRGRNRVTGLEEMPEAPGAGLTDEASRPTLLAQPR